MSNISRFLIVAEGGDDGHIAEMASEFKEMLRKQDVVFLSDCLDGVLCRGLVLRVKQVKRNILALDIEDSSLDSVSVMELALPMSREDSRFKIVASGKDASGNDFATDEVGEYIDLIELEI